jgi:hypothetical protein
MSTFTALATNFYWLRYAGCKTCMVYTRNDSAACDQFIFFTTPPGEEWTPQLGDLEALAAMADTWDKEDGDGTA